MPKKGKCNAAEAAEEHQAGYVKLRHAHSAVESNINSLEHHGLDRCPDKGFHGYQRYADLGVLANNLHQIGKGILRQAKEAEEKAAKRRQRQGRKKVQQDDVAASFLDPYCRQQPPRSPKRLDSRTHATQTIEISRHRGVSKAHKPPRESQKPPEPDLTNRPALVKMQNCAHFFSGTTYASPANSFLRPFIERLQNALTSRASKHGRPPAIFIVRLARSALHKLN